MWETLDHNGEHQIPHGNGLEQTQTADLTQSKAK